MEEGIWKVFLDVWHLQYKQRDNSSPVNLLERYLYHVHVCRPDVFQGVGGQFPKGTNQEICLHTCV
jgi:hypothetical protein